MPMVPFLTRHLIVPLHERLLGRRTLAFVEAMMHTQWLAPDDLAAMQRRKLRALLQHAHANTTFYRRRIQRTGADLVCDDPIAVLRALPPLTKAEIRAHREEMTWPAVPGGLIPAETGGSTGEPLRFFLDRRRQAFDQAARIRSHRWFGVEVGERELFLWGSPIEWKRTDALKRFRDSLFNHRLLSAFDMSPARMDAYLDELERFRPAALFGYPSSLALLAEHARRRGRRPDLRNLKVVFVTGETCLPPQRALLEECFQVPVADGYGSREGGFIAHACPRGGMHITAENVYVEILNDRGEPVPAGETGEIALTHLDAYAMPLIRYRTGDRGRMGKGRCACGRGLPLLESVEGRNTDFLYFPDGTIKHALSVIYPLREMEGVRQFRVEQREDYSVCVKLVPEPSQNGRTKEIAVRRLLPVLHPVSFRVELVDGIPVTASGKYRYVVSHVRPSAEIVAPEGDRA
ncbi:MAG: phenylacetate--CoA ligase family protein [Planctomycetota bacterium]|nr:MAG: phenylacetate--CoA ligase family protein [Planctomycetota bacterium]